MLEDGAEGGQDLLWLTNSIVAFLAFQSSRAVSGGDVTVEAAVQQLRHYLAQFAEAGRVLRARKSQEVS